MKELNLLLFLCFYCTLAYSLPNFVVILTDDMGYGDIGIYGSPSIKTPRLDDMARNGLKFDHLYTAQPICTPSRGALFTGRQPVRIGMYQNIQTDGDRCVDAHGLSSVLWWDSLGGLQNDTLTLPQLLKNAGYHTSLVGKWHVGIGKNYEYLPLQKGFDEFFGTPLWHMQAENQSQIPDVPLMEGNKILGRLYADIDISTVTEMYLNRSIQIINQNKNQPFFLYYAPDGTHAPTYAGKNFQGKSARGAYGDAVEEMDYTVGQILDLLKQLNLDDNTFVFWSSDNGPALYQGVESDTMYGKLQGGSAGPLFGGKGTTWEGGIRMPAIAYWPGKIQPGVTVEMASLLDLFPTILELANVTVPSNYVLDGESMTDILFNQGPSKHEFLYHWRGDTLYAVSWGFYKAHFWTQGGKMYTIPGIEKHDPPLLFNVMHDPSEQFPINGTKDDPNYKQIIQTITNAAQNEIKSMVLATPQFNNCDPAAGMWSPDFPTPPNKPNCCFGGGN
eukprot:TRINITY_DN4763_c0_g3_i1.p1 TRINITY_DN4763_c0_g3~~TRINITY_DN4763_c0_g3_i1.p1  ORF type:complete len:572 (+),score=130.43 TRINITY_DN4763_c0_g3_i1:213-1718(+)